MKTRSGRQYQSHYRTISGAAGYALGSAGRYLYGKWYGKSNTARKGRSVYGGVTQQHDVRTLYRKRRMPRRKRKRWVRFVKKVQAVNNKQLGTRSVLFNDTISVNPGVAAQNYLSFLLYGGNGTNNVQEQGLDDLQKIKQGDTQIGPTANVHFGSAVLDLTLVNTPVGEINPAFNYTLEVDIYVVWYRPNEFQFANLNAAFSQANTDGTVIGTTPITIDVRGATPFNLPNFLKLSKMNIIRKTKYYISPGQAVSYQFRDAKNRMLYGRDMDALSNNDMSYKGLTRGVFIISKCVDSGNSASQLVIRGTRTYSYFISELSQHPTGVL